MTRKLWQASRMADADVRVYIASPDDPDLMVDGVPAEGICLRGDGVILINADVPAQRRLGVLVHELIHQAVFLSGAKATLRLSDDREEALVSAVTPLLTHWLTEARMLRGRRVQG